MAFSVKSPSLSMHATPDVHVAAVHGCSAAVLVPCDLCLSVPSVGLRPPRPSGEPVNRSPCSHSSKFLLVEQSYLWIFMFMFPRWTLLGLIHYSLKRDRLINVKTCFHLENKSGSFIKNYKCPPHGKRVTDVKRWCFWKYLENSSSVCRLAAREKTEGKFAVWWDDFG